MSRVSETHVWTADVDNLSVDEAYVDSLLCREEKARSQRFAFEVLKRRYRISHAALRAVLAYCTGRKTTELMFSTLRYGKPFLEGGPQFNASMSGPMLLIAVGERSPVGIDVEMVADLEDLDKLAIHYFSETERAALSLLCGSERVRGFYRIWTRKEAVIKALGVGLNLDLQSFSVPVDYCDVNDPIGVHAESEGIQHYFVRPLHVPRVCEAAIASTAPVVLQGRHRIGDGLQWESSSSH